MLNFIALNKSVHVQHSFAVLYHEPWSLKEFRSNMHMVVPTFTFYQKCPQVIYSQGKCLFRGLKKCGTYVLLLLCGIKKFQA